MTTTETTLTYRGDPDLKAGLVAEMAEHQRRDMLTQGRYLRPDGKGCAIGCTIAGRLLTELGSAEAVEDHVNASGGWHKTWAEVTGLPEWLGGLDDMVFEGLAAEDSRAWPVRLLDAVPVGVDLEPVRGPLIRDLVMDGVRGAVAVAAVALESAGFPAHAGGLRAVPFDASYDVVWRAVASAAYGRKAPSATRVDRAGAAYTAYVCVSSACSAVDAARDGASGYTARGAARTVPNGDARRAQWAWIADLLIGHLAAAGEVTE